MSNSTRTPDYYIKKKEVKNDLFFYLAPPLGLEPRTL